MIKGILFDLDGVLIETEQETFNFYKEELLKYNIELKDSDFKYKAGRKSVDFWNDVLSEGQLAEIDVKLLTQKKRDAFNANPDKYLKKTEGVRELLEELKNANYKIALTSQNEAKMINTVVDWLNIREYFDVILSIDDIERLKPEPEIYEKAMGALDLKAEESIVIEDSADGVKAAKAAGCKCIGIKHFYTPEGDLDMADLVVEGIGQVDLSKITSI